MAADPIATLQEPVVLEHNEDAPTTVLVATPPAPRPTLTVLTTSIAPSKVRLACANAWLVDDPVAVSTLVDAGSMML